MIEASSKPLMALPRAAFRALLAAFALAAAAWLIAASTPAMAQGSERMPVEIAASKIQTAPDGSQSFTLALHFVPSTPEWHGYWSNPGDAGQGLSLDWSWPDTWFGEPQYPVPQTLVIGGLMNHVYEGPHAVLVPVRIPSEAARDDLGPLRVAVNYLACTDRICVPQRAELELTSYGDPPIDRWRGDIAPQLDREGVWEIADGRLRIGIALPEAVGLSDPHLFIGATRIGEARPDFAAPQTFRRQGNMLVGEVPLRDRGAVSEMAVEGILAFGSGRGVRFVAQPGDVPLEGVEPIAGGAQSPALWLLLLAAFAGGVLLNVMPCVFPILSLKALALARAGGEAMSARRDALAYTAGIVLACVALGAVLLVLRAAGEQVGWAFQLQEPAVVVALLLLAVALTANFLGVFEVPGMAISGGGSTTRGSFATGLLAAFVATPCTGPFMAIALGAALVIPPLQGAAIFLALGLGLAAPFLAIGFIPAIRGRLPRPGPWMERFRRWMAVPMGLTALALGWLVWRIGGWEFLALVAVLGVLALAGLMLAGLFQRRGRGGAAVLLGALVAVLALGVALLPQPSAQAASEESLLDPASFSEAALAEARGSGRPVFVWFTADWCVSCKVNESVAIETEATRAAFEDAGVVTLRGDWTRPDAGIAAFLAQSGAAGVPLYLWYEPGGEAEQLPQVLTPDLLAERASRSAARSRADIRRSDAPASRSN